MIDLLAGIFIGAMVTCVIGAIVLFYGRREGIFEIKVHESAKAMTELSFKPAPAAEVEAIGRRLKVIEEALAPYLNKKE